MSQASNTDDNMLETQENNQPIQQSIIIYLQNLTKNIRNKRYIDTVKVPFNTRILSINTDRFKPSNEEKIQMIIEVCERLSIDILLLNETNTKWILQNQDKITKHLKRLGREMNVQTADSQKWEITKNE